VRISPRSHDAVLKLVLQEAEGETFFTPLVPEFQVTYRAVLHNLHFMADCSTKDRPVSP
jgi:hypothetical protein